jgi:hypothetical protein
MKIYLLSLALFLGYNFSIAQDKLPAKRHSIQLDIGMSRHGTGDMRGLFLNSEYKKYFLKKLSISFGISATIHDGVSPLFFTDSNGNCTDASYRYSSGGLQLTGKFGLNLYRSKWSELGLQIGGLLRYQTSSYYDELIVLFPALPGFPMPVTIIINNSPQRTFSIGCIGQLFYNYSLTEKLFIGILTGLQLDTNGDTITQLGLSCGFKF